MSSPSITGNKVFGGTVTIDVGWSGTSSLCTYAKVTYEFEGTTGTINAKVPKGTDTITWTIPKSWANKVPNSSYGSIKIISAKYDDKAFCWNSGSSYIRADFPSDMYPSIDSVKLTEAVSEVASSNYGYLQNKSKIKINITASGKYSATIKSYKVVINGVTYTSSAPTTGVLKTSGNNAYQITVTDSRGKTKTTSGTFEVIPYVKPKITNFTIARCDQDGTLNEEGTYAKVISGATISSCNNGTTDQNIKSYKLSYKLTTATEWTDISLPNSSYALSDTRILSGFDINNTYNFKLEATDYFETTSKTLILETSDNIMDFLANGKGMAIGKAAEYEDTLDIGYSKTYLSKSVHMGGEQRSDDEKNIYFYNTQQGNYPHKTKIYGGNGSSEIALGCYDTEKDIRVWGYFDQSGKFVISGDLDLYHGNEKVVTNGDGWHDAILTSSFKNYNNETTNRPRYRKIGDIVSIIGCVSPTSNIEGSGTGVEIFTLPAGYRPTGLGRTQICQGSGSNKWLLNISTGGVVTFARYGTNAFATCTPDNWLPFNMTFII